MPNGVRARGNSRVANQRRNMMEDGLIHATTIIENAENVIIQAQEYDTSDLDTRILQLENEMKVMKKQSKKDKQQNERMIRLLKNKLKTCGDNFSNLMKFLTKLNMLSPNSTESNITIKSINMAYDKVEVIGNPEDCKYKMKTCSSGDFDKIQQYVDRLEMIIANNKLSLDCMSEIQSYEGGSPPTVEEFTRIMKEMGRKSCDNNPNFYGFTEGLPRNGPRGVVNEE
tara:strand:- start:4796 stop:5476 length:681 start_codon:yes stop_codon:yes gene_type:complete